jgi:hypothetical protein
MPVHIFDLPADRHDPEGLKTKILNKEQLSVTTSYEGQIKYHFLFCDEDGGAFGFTIALQTGKEPDEVKPFIVRSGVDLTQSLNTIRSRGDEPFYVEPGERTVQEYSSTSAYPRKEEIMAINESASPTLN